MDKPLPLSFYPARPRLYRSVSTQDGFDFASISEAELRQTMMYERHNLCYHQGGARHRAPLREEWGDCYFDWTCKVNRATCLGDRL